MQAHTEGVLIVSGLRHEHIYEGVLLVSGLRHDHIYVRLVIHSHNKSMVWMYFYL
jgi:hypothetical protein